MEPILDRIKKGEILVADGAMGTMLFQKGLKPGECPETLNLTNPEILEDIARDFLNAGAEIIQTNTFGASPINLREYGMEDKTEEINTIAVSCVKKSVKGQAYISGSCGPSGKLLKPYSDVSSESLFLSFFRQMKALVTSDVDIICVETMIDLQEATLAIKAAKTVSPQIPVMATMTFDKTPKGFYTVMGVSIKKAAVDLQEAGADIVGSNCGNGIENMVEIAVEFSNSTPLPLLIQSNAGQPETREGKLFYSETPGLFAEKTKDLIDAGVSIIGGCCGTTPEHIKAIRKSVNSFQHSTE